MELEKSKSFVVDGMCKNYLKDYSIPLLKNQFTYFTEANIKKLEKFYENTVNSEIECIEGSKSGEQNFPLIVNVGDTDIQIRCTKCGKIYSMKGVGRFPSKTPSELSDDERLLENILYAGNSLLKARIDTLALEYLENKCKSSNVTLDKLISKIINNYLPESLIELLGEDKYEFFCNEIIKRIKDKMQDTTRNFATYLSETFFNVTDEDFGKNLYELLNGKVAGTVTYQNTFTNLLISKGSYIKQIKNIIKSDKDIIDNYDKSINSLKL